MQIKHRTADSTRADFKNQKKSKEILRQRYARERPARVSVRAVVAGRTGAALAIHVSRSTLRFTKQIAGHHRLGLAIESKIGVMAEFRRERSSFIEAHIISAGRAQLRWRLERFSSRRADCFSICSWQQAGSSFSCEQERRPFYGQ